MPARFFWATGDRRSPVRTGQRRHFVASFVGNFVAFVESNRESPREGAKNGSREWTPMHAKEIKRVE